MFVDGWVLPGTWFPGFQANAVEVVQNLAMSAGCSMQGVLLEPPSVERGTVPPEFGSRKIRPCFFEKFRGAMQAGKVTAKEGEWSDERF